VCEVRRVFRTQDGKYDALLCFTLGGRRYYAVFAGLARQPREVKVVEATGGVVRVEVLDEFGRGFLSCSIDRRYFEEGFFSSRCAPGVLWIVSEEEFLRHRSCAEAGREG